MANTPVYSSVIDFVWDWATQSGAWAQTLVEKLVNSGRRLSDEDRRLVHNIFLKSLGVTISLAEQQTPQKPTLPTSSANLILTSLSEVSGVNCLAPSQELRFGRNLTVVYGDNGTGKSGYGRILRAIGRGYELPPPVLGDVYSDKKEPRTAKVVYSGEDECKEFIWNDASQNNVPLELKNLIFFNNECVEVSISPDRGLLVSPVGFELFRTVSEELSHLERFHQELINAQKVELNWENQLTYNSEVHKFLATLTSETNLDQLTKIAIFDDQSQLKFTDLELEQKELNPRLIETDIKNLTAQKSELEAILVRIKTARASFTEEFLDSYGKDLVDITELRKGHVQSITDVAKDYGVFFLESEEFRSFLQSAESYLKKIDNQEYPSKDKDLCIFCNQVIKEESSVSLIKKYREVMSNLTKSKIEVIDRRLTAKKEQVRREDSKLRLALGCFGESEEGLPIQPECLITYNSALSELQTRISDISVDSSVTFSINLDWEEVLRPLDERIISLNLAIKEKREKLANQKDLELKIKAQLSELKDRNLICEKKTEVESKIKGLKATKRLKDATSKLSSGNLSRKTSEARNLLVESRLLKGFQEELSILSKPHLKVELDFRTDKGVSKLLQVIEQEHSVGDVLSEGEQKAISLCELLAELRLDQSTCPIVLDDPVTSLDHHFIDDIAKRFVKLCLERQVIVFTHSILLLNAFKQRVNAKHIKKKKLDIQFYEVLRGDGIAGILKDGGTLAEETFKLYESKVNSILNSSKEDKLAKSLELAIKGYEHLRAGIEVFVSEEIFLGAVKRYRKNITLTKLESISGALIDEHKEEIYGLFEKCSGFVDSHSKVDGVNVNPDLSSLRSDLDKLLKIRTCFLNKGQDVKQANL